MNYDPNTGQPINNGFQQPVQQKQTNVIAIVALILSIIGFNLISLIMGIIGLKKSKELNDGKGIAIAAIIISILQTILITVSVAMFVLSVNTVGPEVKKTINITTKCSIAYDCEMINKSEYSCKYKEETIICNWEYINANQIKTTPTTKLAEDYETVLKRELDFNKLIKDDKLNIKINGKNNNIRKEKIDKLPDKIDNESEYTYVINNNKHTIKEYLYNAKEDFADGGYMYDVLVTIDGYAYKFDKTRFENYEDNEYLNIYIDSNYTEYSEVLKDIATGKEYYMLVYYYRGGSTHYQFVIIDDDGNILMTYEDGGEFYLDSDSWDEDHPYLSKKVIEYKDDKFKFMIDSSYVSYDINNNYKDHKTYGREVYGYIKNGEIIFENGNIVEGQFAGQE